MLRLSLLILLLLVCAGCRREAGADAQEQEEAADAAPKTGQLPALRLTDETADLLLTWIDDKGDFHVVSKIADVPEKSRDRVRVVVTSKRAGTTDLLYVADLRKKNPDGAYPIKTLTRSAWEEFGAKKRKKRMESLAASAAPKSSAAAPSATPGAGALPGQPGAKGAASKASGVVAIVYGAAWCGPCHMAQRYLKSRGVTVVYKDIDASEVARREMQQKLHSQGRSGASIPIIDIGGQLLVGYSPSALDHALKVAQQAKRL